MLTNNDEKYMKQALMEAQKALEKNEVPIGAIVVYKNQIIARAYNMTESLNDVTAHAEMIAITSAANQLGGKYLDECTMYVTLEPCIMCAGALSWSQMKRLVFGAKDVKRGYSATNINILHPKTEITYSILEAECSEIVLQFFRQKR